MVATVSTTEEGVNRFYIRLVTSQMQRHWQVAETAGFYGTEARNCLCDDHGWIRVLGSLAGVVDGGRHEELGRRGYYPDSSAPAQGQLGFGKHNALWLSLAEFRRNVCVSDLLRPKQASQCMCFACQRRCQKQQRFLRNE